MNATNPIKRSPHERITKSGSEFSHQVRLISFNGTEALVIFHLTLERTQHAVKTIREAGLEFSVYGSDFPILFEGEKSIKERPGLKKRSQVHSFDRYATFVEHIPLEKTYAIVTGSFHVLFKSAISTEELRVIRFQLCLKPKMMLSIHNP